MYWRLLERLPASKLHLTKHDDDLQDAFKSAFPEYFSESLDALRHVDEDAMKSAKGKERWRAFIKPWEKLEDYNFGTLFRLHADDELTEANSTIGAWSRRIG